jgi:hypothetical protein|tara:strand:+ start:858 stop:1028 length:171 start_codon:yes stop_codon:yes gene_type:complete
MYKVKLIKDRFPHKEGDFYGPVDRDGYMNLLNEGVIEDEFNLIKKTTKKESKKKSD